MGGCNRESVWEERYSISCPNTTTCVYIGVHGIEEGEKKLTMTCGSYRTHKSNRQESLQ